MSRRPRGGHPRQELSGTWSGWGLAGVLGVLLVAPVPGFALDAPEEPVLGAPSGFDAASLEEERIAVTAGRRLHAEANFLSPILATLEVTTELPVVERQGGWVRVRHGSIKGWLLAHQAEGESAGQPGGPAEPRLLGPTSQPADPDRLRRAREILGDDAREAHLPLGSMPGDGESAYLLLTGEPPGGEIASLLGLDLWAAGELEAVYHDRFGIAPLESRGEVIVLFARREDYARFSSRQLQVAAPGTWGHAGGGIAALGVEGKSPEEVRSLLVHELTHLISRRALGREVPAWLEEGLAEDLAMSDFDARGKLRPDTLHGRPQRLGMATVAPGVGPSAQLVASGPRIALDRLVRAARRAGLPSVRELLESDAESLAAPEQRALLYPMSGFFVRFLLADQGPRAAAFRAYLVALAQGGAVDPEALRERLDTTWEELDEAFGLWLRRQR